MEILNRKGHCVSNSTVEELETELTFEANKNSKETPLGMKTTPEFNIGVAWDKFDHFVETKSSKDALHDTVGIAYQMQDVPMTNTTAMHSEKSTIVVTAYHYHNNQVLDKSNNCHRKTMD